MTNGFLPVFTYQAFQNTQSGPPASPREPAARFLLLLQHPQALRPWASATTTVCLSFLFVCCEKYQIYLHKHTKPSPPGTQQTLCQTFARFAGNTETRQCPVVPNPTSVTASCCPSTDGRRTFLQVMTELETRFRLRSRTTSFSTKELLRSRTCSRESRTPTRRGRERTIFGDREEGMQNELSPLTASRSARPERGPSVVRSPRHRS